MNCLRCGKEVGRRGWKCDACGYRWDISHDWIKNNRTIREEVDQKITYIPVGTLLIANSEEL